LTLHENREDNATASAGTSSVSDGGRLLAPPKLQLRPTWSFCRRKRGSHRGHGRGHFAGQQGRPACLAAFVEKAAELLGKQIHLLILDALPPGRRDPQGIHAAIWEEISGQEYSLPTDKPLTLAAYESGLSVRAYVVHVAVGELLADMPLFFAPTAPCAYPPRRPRLP
jgi:hypothetical protein